MKKPTYIKEKIALLERVKIYITEKRSKGLCYAINHCHLDCDFDVGVQIRRTLRDYVQKAIGGNLFLEHWQSENGFPHRTDKEALQDRLDWVDWMIADYQKWGVK